MNEVSTSNHVQKHGLTFRQWNKIIGGDAVETGSGPGSYDIRKSVWHVNVSWFSRWNTAAFAYSCSVL